MIIKRLLLIPLFFLLFIEVVMAHCPLCTAGAAVAAGGAVYLGMNLIAIGLFIGAFAVSLGWWFSKLLKKRYIPLQKPLIIIFSFLITILPMLSIMKEIFPIYISFFGDYGSLLNRTYLINKFLLGSLIGGIIVTLTPGISKGITRIRKDKAIPFQGIILTLVLLIITAVIIQLVN